MDEQLGTCERSCIQLLLRVFPEQLFANTLGGFRAVLNLQRTRGFEFVQVLHDKIGDVEFDPAAREVVVRGQRPAFTSTELGILELLMRRSPGVADRRSIAQHVWDNEADAFGSNTIDVHLARLRSKLAGAGVRIQTVRGVGYRISSA